MDKTHSVEGAHNPANCDDLLEASSLHTVSATNSFPKSVGEVDYLADEEAGDSGYDHLGHDQWQEENASGSR